MDHFKNLLDIAKDNLVFVLVIFLIVALFYFVAITGEKMIRIANINPGLTIGQNKNHVTKIVLIAMMSAIAIIMNLFSFETPLFPTFYKLDFSEIPILIVSFYLGPVAGVTSELLKVLLNILINGTKTAFIGEFANFAIGCSFVLPAALFYRVIHSKKGAYIAVGVGTAFLVVFSLLFNALYLLPAFADFYNRDLEDIIKMGTKINSNIDSISTFLIFATLPVNLIKGVVCSVVTVIIYKPFSKVVNTLR